MKLVVIKNFRLDDPDAGTLRYRRGMVIAETDIPGGHSAEAWISKGLVKPAAVRPSR